jgi:hypothetical protein
MSTTTLSERLEEFARAGSLPINDACAQAADEIRRLQSGAARVSDEIAIEERIARLVAHVEADEGIIGVLPTGEQLAVALVLDRKDLLDRWGYSMLEAVARLGPEWTRAALAVQRSR